MLITNHVLSGSLIGMAVRHPLKAFGIGVVSHLALDALPHWGDKPIDEVMPIAVADGLTGLVVMGTLWVKAPPGDRASVLAGMAGACLLDMDKPGNVFFGKSPFPKVVDRFHGWIQTEHDYRMPQEFATGFALAGVYAGWRALKLRNSSRGE